EQSTSSFKTEVERLSIKEIYELIKDLRLYNKPEIFETSYDIILNKKLLPLLKETEALEKTLKKDGFLILRDTLYKETGFSSDLNTLPSTTLRKIIDEISSWSP
ncbi:MAG: hypothetical protein Q7U96_06205, partial [Chloroflexota bacterium]|nr:hypothetical protein [Chloroflexota bacterium]